MHVCMYVCMYAYIYIIYVCIYVCIWTVFLTYVVIADLKSKIILSRHFFADVIFSGTSKFKTIKILIPKQTCAQYLFQGILKIFLNIYALLFIFRKL